MEENRLVVVDIGEIAERWQLPVDVIVFFIIEYGLDPVEPEKWVPDHWDLWMAEKQKAFESSLFPRRPEFAETPS